MLGELRSIGSSWTGTIWKGLNIFSLPWEDLLRHFC